MTVTQHPPGSPNGPATGGLGSQDRGSTEYDWRYAHPSTPKPRQALGKLPASVIAITALLAVAALAVSIFALVTRSPVERPSTVTATGDTTAADRSLCTGIAPLMAEDNAKSTAWINTGAPGTPARDAALPGFREYTEDWAGRIQDVVDANPNAHPFLLRTLQRFIDDRVLLARNMRSGPPEKYDDAAWTDSMTAYGGPQSVCGELGVKW